MISSSQRPLPDNNHNRQISMPPVGFEPTISASKAAADLRLRPRGRWDRLHSLSAASWCTDLPNGSFHRHFYETYDLGLITFSFVFLHSFKKNRLTRKLKIKIDSAAPSEGQGRLAYVVIFSWPPLEAALSISKFFFLFTHWLWSVGFRKKLPSVKITKYDV